MRRRASLLAAMGAGAAVLVGARWLVRAPRGAKQASPAPASDPSGPVAGEFDRSYFDAALPQRFAHAQRRLQPISLVLVGIESPGTDPGTAFDALVSALRSTIRASDTVCRIGPDRLGLILEDATEYGAVFAVERARNVLLDAGREHDIVVGVASYPSHAMALDELVDQAEDALERAREHPRARFSVADAKP
ncbi:MAG: diguanylate cyclase [Acidimicrobiia bacterium]